MPSNNYPDYRIRPEGRTYPESTPDVADFATRIEDLEDADTDLDGEDRLDAIEAGKRMYVFMGTISSKASDAAVARLGSPVAGTLLKIKTILNGALATGNATFQAKVKGSNAGSTTTGLVTATQASSAAGDVDSASPVTTNVTLAEDDLIEVVCGGASTATATASVYALIRY